MVLKERSAEYDELHRRQAGPNSGQRSPGDVGVLLFQQVESSRLGCLCHCLSIGKWPQNLELARNGRTRQASDFALIRRYLDALGTPFRDLDAGAVSQASGQIVGIVDFAGRLVKPRQ